VHDWDTAGIPDGLLHLFVSVQFLICSPEVVQLVQFVQFQIGSHTTASLQGVDISVPFLHAYMSFVLCVHPAIAIITRIMNSNVSLMTIFSHAKT
jgi:hypothetical protein